MTLEVLTTLEELQSFEPEWLRLWHSSPRATPFQSPQWLLPWTRHLFGGGEIWAVVMRDGADAVGFAPLFCWGTETRTVSFLGAGISDYGDMLCAPERERECAALMSDFLDSRRERWAELDLQEIPENSALLNRYPHQPCSVCPVLDLKTFPAEMDSKHRTDLRRARNKLAKGFDPQFTWEQNLDPFLRLHAMRWSALEPALVRFHREVANNFAQTGNLRLAMLSLNGAPAAAIYAFTAVDTLYCYLSGYDPELAKLSPGSVLLGWVVDEAIREGLTQIDFLRNTESYKYLWGAKDRHTYQVKSLVGMHGSQTKAVD